MENIEFTQQQNETELRDEVEVWYKTFIGRSYYVWLGPVVLIGGAVTSFVRQGGTKQAMLLAAGAVVFFLYIFVLRRKLAVTQVFNALRISPIFGKLTQITITPGGTISIACDGYEGRHNLKNFGKAVETESNLMLFVNKSGWITLKRNAFPSQVEYDRFLHNVELNGIKLERYKNEK